MTGIAARRHAVLGAGTAGLFLVVPLFGFDEYWIYILTIGFYYAILASSWSLLVGYVGRISFAHVAMSGIGAYTSVLVNGMLGWPLILSIPLAGVVTGLVGLVIGRLCLQLHGAYLGLTTIAFSEIVRITVDREEAAKAVPHIRDRLMMEGVEVPLVGDFHYIGHQLLTKYPDCADALAKYRINPGNVGFREKRDTQFSTMIEVALKHDRPVRIGVNWGSLDQELLARLMDENAASGAPREAAEIVREAMVQSALLSCERAHELGMGADKIVISCKVSEVQDLIADDLINVFLPTTPNPTSGFLLFVPKEDLIILKMTVEEAIKMVISAGIVTPPDRRPETIKGTPVTGSKETWEQRYEPTAATNRTEE